MANFLTVMRPTPFGFYDADTQFQKDADNVVTFVLRKHGEDILQVELTKKMIWSCFEEATFTFNAMLVEYQAKSNLASLLGTPTGSYDPTTGFSSINLANNYIIPNLEFLEKMAEPYSNLIGWGSSQGTVSGAITIESGREDYNLYTELKDLNTGQPLFNMQPAGSQGKMRVVEVFHFAPVQYVFNSNLASNFVAQGLPIESYIPDTRFYVLPLFEDVLRAGMLKEAQRVRRSNYSYKISGETIRMLPCPNAVVQGYNDKIWVRVGFPAAVSPYPSGSYLGSGQIGAMTATSNTFFGASNPANIPFGLVTYSSLNPWARNWIYQMTFAICTELLGRVRGKMKTIPIPGAELSLNGSELESAGREDKDKLITSLRERLDDLTYEKIAEREAAKSENMLKQLNAVPIPPTCIITCR